MMKRKLNTICDELLEAVKLHASNLSFFVHVHFNTGNPVYAWMLKSINPSSEELF